MNENWMSILVQLKKRYVLLSEVYDLTIQMEEALARNDMVSLRMVIAMRQDPILKLKESDRYLAKLFKNSPDDINDRFDKIQKDENAHTYNDDEMMVKKQIHQNRRLIEKLKQFDKNVYQKLSRK